MGSPKVKIRGNLEIRTLEGLEDFNGFQKDKICVNLGTRTLGNLVRDTSSSSSCEGMQDIRTFQGLDKSLGIQEIHTRECSEKVNIRGSQYTRYLQGNEKNWRTQDTYYSTRYRPCIGNKRYINWCL